MFPFRSIGVAVMLCVESLACAQQGTSSGHLGLLRRQLEMRKVALVTDSSLHLKSCPQKEMYVLMDKNELKKAGLKLFPVEMEKVFILLYTTLLNVPFAFIIVADEVTERGAIAARSIVFIGERAKL